MKARWIALAIGIAGCAPDQTSAPPNAAATPAPATAITPAPVVVATMAPPPTVESTPAPAKPSPVTEAPKAAPDRPVPARTRLIVPGGTLLPIELQTTVSSDSSRAGDSVLAQLTEEVRLDGFTLDKGAEVRGRVTTVVPAKRVKGRARLVVVFDAVMEAGEKLSIETEPIDSSAKSTSSKDKKIIAGGALGGLIVGAIKDGKKGAAIGTVVGAAAGTGTVLVMKGDEVELPRGATLTLTVRK